MRKNDLIIAYVTAYGRIMLHEVEHMLGFDLLYVDTDSAFHIKPRETQRKLYETGFRAGDLELELEEGCHWVGLGRKSYAYEKNGKSVCKQKGVRLMMKDVDLFKSERLENILNPEESREITVTQQYFDTIQESGNFMKRTRRSEKRTSFRPFVTKRMIDWSNKDYIISYPYGYRRNK
jgi:hypothetical protein